MEHGAWWRKSRKQQQKMAAILSYLLFRFIIDLTRLSRQNRKSRFYNIDKLTVGDDKKYH